MTTAEVIVKVRFDQGWNDTTTSEGYTTISTANPVRQLYMTRGKKDALDKLQAGRCVLVVDNTNGRLDPANTSSPYRDSGATEVLPGRAIQVIVVDPSDSTERSMFSGFVERWVQRQQGGGHDQVTIIEAVDWIKPLAMAKCDASTEAEEGSGERIVALIRMSNEAVAISYQTTAVQTVPEKAYTTSMNVLDEINKVNDAEVGTVYSTRLTKTLDVASRGERLSGDGKLVAQFTDDTSADSGWLPFHDVTMFWDDQKIVNQADATLYGTSTTATQSANALSKTRYGVRAVDKTAIMLSTAAAATEWCAFLVDRHKEPGDRVGALKLLPQADGDLWEIVIESDPGMFYQVRRHPKTGSTVTQDVILEGITHRADANRWETTFNLSPTGGYWVLDSDGTGVYASMSTLGTTTKLAFVDY